MIKNNVKINPEFISHYNNLKSACFRFNAVKAKYGPNSSEYINAFKKRQIAESLYANAKGLISDNSRNAFNEDSAKSILKSYTSNVHSWYA